MYLLDANVLIEAKNRYYGFDIAPGFWQWLEQAYEQFLICSIQPVREELKEGNDRLATWAQEHPKFFREIDQGTTKHFGTIARWAVSRNYTHAALTAFTSNDTDFLLVAYAHEHHYVVVTHELSDPKARKRVKIPDACQAMKVQYTDTFQMLRETGAQFILPS